ncbi:MAG: hypothetical protein RR246_04565, partial [Clostridia bacterium]
GAKILDDVMTKLFLKCKIHGIKLYVGMGNTAGGWPYLDFLKPGNAEKFKRICEKFAVIAEDMYNIYYKDYPETFFGFYFVPELYNSSAFDNDASRATYVSGLSGGINIILDKINSLNPNLPFLFSPYVNLFGGDWVSKNFDNISKFWCEYLATANFRDGDTICPQDSVGAGGCDLTLLDSMSNAYKKAVDNCGKKIKFYSNCEIFMQPKGDFFGEKNFPTWSGCTTERMTEQFKIVSKYVERIFVFSVPHYLSNVNAANGYYDSYMYFLENGAIERELPTPPNKFRTAFTKIDGKKCLSIYWSGMYDNIGVHRVNIYKNNEFFTFRIPVQKIGSNGKLIYQNNFFDLTFTPDTTKPATYEFEVIDCAGNVSERSSFTVNPETVPNKQILDPFYKGPTDNSTGDESSNANNSEATSSTESNTESANESNQSADSSATESDSNKKGSSKPWIYGGIAVGTIAIAATAFAIFKHKKK